MADKEQEVDQLRQAWFDRLRYRLVETVPIGPPLDTAEALYLYKHPILPLVLTTAIELIQEMTSSALPSPISIAPERDVDMQ